MDTTPGALPLIQMKQAMMKIDSAMSDIAECKEDEDIDEEARDSFNVIYDQLTHIEAVLVNTAAKEIGEEEFLAEDIPMDPIEDSFDEEDDIMNAEI